MHAGVIRVATRHSHCLKSALALSALLVLACGCNMHGGHKPFNGHDLTGWKALNPGNNTWRAAGNVTMDPANPKRFVIEDGEGLLVNGPTGQTSNIYTEEEFGDCRLHVEFMVPEGSNSGVYLQGRYEIQVLDSFGKSKVDFSDCGGIYAEWIKEQNVRGHAPMYNASRPPGEWQCLDAIFLAPRFDSDGKKVANARFLEVKLNDILVQNNVELFNPTRAHLPGKEAPLGPLMLQGDHGPVVYRNIRIAPYDKTCCAICGR